MAKKNEQTETTNETETETRKTVTPEDRKVYPSRNGFYSKSRTETARCNLRGHLTIPRAYGRPLSITTKRIASSRSRTRLAKQMCKVIWQRLARKTGQNC
jgi:hypothetical protein